MATEVILPRVDMDMAEGKIAKWYVEEGDVVRKGQILFEIETDKATMEIEAPSDGVMHAINGAIGVDLPVGQVIAWILAPDEVGLASGAGQRNETQSPPGVVPGAPNATAGTRAIERPSAEPAQAVLPRATPLARSLARQHGLDLSRIAGSGPGGRVLGRDMHSALDAAASKRAASARSELHLGWPRRAAGTPLLLIHGFGADQGSWRPLLPHLPDGLALVAIDLPNHGKSPATPVLTLEEMAQLVLQRLDREGLTSCHLLGHSLGGAVALALTRIAPNRVRSMTLLAPAGLGPDINAAFIDGLLEAADEFALRTTLTALFHNPAALTGSFVATAFQQLQTADGRRALSAMAQHLMPRGRQSESLRDVFDGLQLPTQLIWGIVDRIISMRHALGLPANVGVHLLPAVGHLPQVESPAIVAALVSHQLRGPSELDSSEGIPGTT